MTEHSSARRRCNSEAGGSPTLRSSQRRVEWQHDLPPRTPVGGRHRRSPADRDSGARNGWPRRWTLVRLIRTSTRGRFRMSYTFKRTFDRVQYQFRAVNRAATGFRTRLVRRNARWFSLGGRSAIAKCPRSEVGTPIADERVHVVGTGRREPAHRRRRRDLLGASTITLSTRSSAATRSLNSSIVRVRSSCGSMTPPRSSVLSTTSRPPRWRRGRIRS